METSTHPAEQHKPARSVGWVKCFLNDIMSTLQPNPARLNQPSSAKRAYRNSRLREHLTHPTEQSTVIMFNRRMFYALSILKIGRSLAHQLAHRTNFSKPPSHNLHWQGKLHRRGNTRCRGPRGEGSNMNLQASAFVKKRKSTIVIHSNPCYITITHPANSNNSWGIPMPIGVVASQAGNF